ncbi:hypothetical protein LAZ67_2000571 [Cordylochernes scorpioides]|uniref:Transposase n=1 Tax=Cordylochernes scorpioides TaxID=51811 RepID=A0ABY6K0R5_9ARAC|nr:hypothetical protein LAZ67_2000571 [Cordylochernes scorpioides]
MSINIHNTTMLCKSQEYSIVEISGIATFNKLKAIFEWYKRFKEGREETADNERSGRPSTSTTPEKVDKVLELVREDRRITVREVAEEAGISFGNGSLNLEATTDDPELLKRVITGDETWNYGFDSETTQQASEWRFKNEPRPKKARKAPIKVKVMLMVFFDYQGIVHHEFQQQGSTITADSYLGVLRRLREAIRQKRPELWRSKSWILHHDNTPAHTALKISKFLQDHSTSVLPQPPYSPDLASCDFFLFGSLMGRKFQSIEEIKVESKKAMKAIPKTNYQRSPRLLPCRGIASEQTLLRLQDRNQIKKTPAKFIPRFLTNEQKLCRLATCEDMLEMTRTDPEWKDKIITGYETWVYGYDPETKHQSAEWRCQGQTVIKEMYLGILRRLREAIRKKRPEKWTNGGWILHHDNARPHTAHLMTSFLAKNGTQILLQPPYFPDIAPNDFFLFPKLKAVLKGRHFDTRDDIIEKSPLALKSIPKEAYKNCFDNWEKRWRWCVEARGDYFEKF